MVVATTWRSVISTISKSFKFIIFFKKNYYIFSYNKLLVFELNLIYLIYVERRKFKFKKKYADRIKEWQQLSVYFDNNKGLIWQFKFLWEWYFLEMEMEILICERSFSPWKFLEHRTISMLKWHSKSLLPYCN